jgi:hypothetical protein
MADVREAKKTDEKIAEAHVNLVKKGPAAAPDVEEETKEPLPEKEEVAAPLELTEPAKEVPTTTIEPPTPVAESTPAKEEIEEPESVIPEEKEAKEDSSKEDETETENIKEQEIEAPKSTTVPVLLPLTEEKKPEAAPEVITAKPEVVEDPEDVKAREEIARLNAEVMKAAEAES